MPSGHYRNLVIKTVSDDWLPKQPVSGSTALLLSDTVSGADASLSRYRDYLGHEFDQVTLDCRSQLHVDAIAALAGTLVAGGELQLLTTPGSTPMLERLQDQWQPPTGSAPALPALPTTQQKQTLQHLADIDHTHILTAERGRGKSYLLGQAVAEAMQRHPDQRIVITAPRKANAAVLLAAAPQAQFVAWDKLLAHKKSDALLVIDEAAGIPLWATQRLCKLYQPWLLATTVNGYEGCGRGFAVHFSHWAKAQLDAVRFHRLDTPIRWPVGDPLEVWLERALLLSSAPEAMTDAPGRTTLHASQLPEDALHQAFELLLEAHYQSSPNDLALLLDDPNQFLTLEYRDNKIIGVTWSALEGPLPFELGQQVIAGKRRPKGNLLPQAIGYFLQQPWAVTSRWCRIVRIAVAEPYRRQGTATELLNTVKRWAHTQQCQYLGTSFGYSPELAAFWRSNGLSSIRTSTALDRVSARHQHIMATTLAATEVNWSALLNYGAAELNWVLSGEREPLPDNPIVNDIINGFEAGYLRQPSAQFALNVC